MTQQTGVVPTAGLTAEDLANLINTNHNSQTQLLTDIRSHLNSCLFNVEGHSVRIEEAEGKIIQNTRAIEEAKENIKVFREDLLASNIQLELCLQMKLKSSFEITVYPPIFLDQIRETLKLEILRKLKARQGGLTSVDLGMNEVVLSPIYINERLTGYMKNIDKHARKAKKDGFLKYIWPKNGIIHGRVNHGTPTINFYCVDDVTNAISNLVLNAIPSVKNNFKINGGPARLADVQLDKILANPNERLTKRKSAEEIAEEAAGSSSKDKLLK